LSTKSSTPQSSKRKRRSISPVIAEDLASSSKSKKAKKMLDLIQATEGKTSASGKNVLNIPYSYSEEDLESVEGEVPEKDAFEEAPLSLEFPDLEIPKASTSKRKKSTSNIEKLKK
jgi:hypothetical protein